jgi:hypothetical protein
MHEAEIEDGGLYELSRVDKSTNFSWYVRERPGQDGVDWGYVKDPSKAVAHTAYWARRFAKDMRYLHQTHTVTRVEESK